MEEAGGLCSVALAPDYVELKDNGTRPELDAAGLAKLFFPLGGVANGN